MTLSQWTTLKTAMVLKKTADVQIQGPKLMVRLTTHLTGGYPPGFFREAQKAFQGQSKLSKELRQLFGVRTMSVDEQIFPRKGEIRLIMKLETSSYNPDTLGGPEGTRNELDDFMRYNGYAANMDIR